MRGFDPYGMKNRGVLETLLGWLLGLIALLICVKVAIGLIRPLLPWVAALVIVSLGARLWARRLDRW